MFKDARPNKFYFISLGCPRNLVDTEVMLGLLLKAGYESTEELTDADFIVVNTCGFLEAAREESLDTIDEVMETKKESAKIIVTGCMVQSHSGDIKAEFPQIDYLLGSGDVKGIIKAIEADLPGEEISEAKSFLESGEVPRTLSTPKHFAYLKIAEGCRKQCSYCIIPQIKGKLKSKSIERVVKEFRSLREQGVHEIILIAQDLGDFGHDAGYKRADGLVDLIKELMKEEGHFWLRLLYLYPDEITDELIELMQQDQRICPYLDMPIQHVNDTLLKAMHRKTNKAHIIDTIMKLRARVPNITIRTSLIVGFPGETEEQFEELCDFIEEYPLDNVGIFTYSNEPGSYSSRLPNQIAEGVKEERKNRLAAIQQEVTQGLQEKLIGQTIDVVVEGYHPESELLMTGRHQGQCPGIDGEVILNDHAEVKAFGQVYRVEISEVMGYDLLGQVKKSTTKWQKSDRTIPLIP